MNAPKMIVEVLAVSEEKPGKIPYISVFVTGSVNILVSSNDPAYGYIKKGLQLTISYDKIVAGESNVPGSKPYVKFQNAKVIDIQEADVTEKNNPFAHLTSVRSNGRTETQEECHLKLVSRV